MLNKRAHVPTWMILLGAIILVGLCIFSFLGYNGDFVKQANDLQKTQIKYLNDETYVRTVFPILVSKSAREASKSDFVSGFNERMNANAAVIAEDASLSGNFFAKIKNADYDLASKGYGEYEITVKGVFVKAQYGNNEMISYMDLTVRFDERGKVLVS